jgi:hypothetical protein
MEEVFLLCDEEGVRTRVVVDFVPHVNSQVYLDHFGDTPLLTFSASPHDEVRLLLKRVMDVLLAAAALVLLSPLMFRKSTAFKIANDPRLTAVGRFLRKFSIDEWPQVMERHKRRHVAGRSTAGGPGGGRAISDLAAKASSHAARTNLLVGPGRARQARFRYLDEDGHAIHRYLAIDAGLEYLAAHDPPRYDR